MSEIEKSLIGVILKDPENYHKAVDAGLSEEMFQTDAARETFAVMKKLADSREQLDLLPLTAKLPERMGFMIEAMESAQVAVNVSWMVGYLRDRKWLREGALVLSRLANDMINAEASSEPELIRERIRNTANDLLKGNEKDSDFIKFSETAGRFVEELETRVANSERKIPRGLPIPLTTIREALLGWLPGRLYILAARPAVGKTTMALNFADLIAAKGHKVFFASNEMGDLELFEKLLAKDSGVFADLIMEGELKEHERDRVMKSMRKLADYPVTVGLTAGRTIESFEAACYKIKREEGLEIAFIDYVQQMNVANKKFARSNRVQELTYISDRLKQLSRDLQIPIIALAQINRDVESAGKSRMPNLANLKDSGSFEQDADAVMILHRQMPENKYLLSLAKNRLGMTGTFEIKADLALNRFVDA